MTGKVSESLSTTQPANANESQTQESFNAEHQQFLMVMHQQHEFEMQRRLQSSQEITHRQWCILQDQIHLCALMKNEALARDAHQTQMQLCDAQLTASKSGASVPSIFTPVSSFLNSPGLQHQCLIAESMRAAIDGQYQFCQPFPVGGTLHGGAQGFNPNTSYAHNGQNNFDGHQMNMQLWQQQQQHHQQQLQQTKQLLEQQALRNQAIQQQHTVQQQQQQQQQQPQKVKILERKGKAVNSKSLPNSQTVVACKTSSIHKNFSKDLKLAKNEAVGKRSPTKKAQKTKQKLPAPDGGSTNSTKNRTPELEDESHKDDNPKKVGTNAVSKAKTNVHKMQENGDPESVENQVYDRKSGVSGADSKISGALSGDESINAKKSEGAEIQEVSQGVPKEAASSPKEGNDEGNKNPVVKNKSRGRPKKRRCTNV